MGVLLILVAVVPRQVAKGSEDRWYRTLDVEGTWCVAITARMFDPERRESKAGRAKAVS